MYAHTHVHLHTHMYTETHAQGAELIVDAVKVHVDGVCVYMNTHAYILYYTRTNAYAYTYICSMLLVDELDYLVTMKQTVLHTHAYTYIHRCMQRASSG